jgi:hypothetical protein
MTRLSFNVQWEFWPDGWISVGFFDNREAANACMDSMLASWPFHSFRVVWKRQRRAA